jgi:hypothetical protein
MIDEAALANFRRAATGLQQGGLIHAPSVPFIRALCLMQIEFKMRFTEFPLVIGPENAHSAIGSEVYFYLRRTLLLAAVFECLQFGRCRNGRPANSRVRADAQEFNPPDL